MSRLNALHANDYPSQTKIHEEFAQLISYLQTCERNGLTIKEQFDLFLDAAAAVKSTFVEFQSNGTYLQYRIGGGSWGNLVSLASITGPAGSPGAGTGDMVRSTYDPDLDGRIAYAQLLLADNDVPQAKINGLPTALTARPQITVSSSAPGSPATNDLWVDTSVTGIKTLKYWDGVATWVTVTSSATSSVDTTRRLSLIAGEAISSRDLCFLATVDGYGSNLATGGTAFASAGTAANAFDGNTGTECDTASGTGNVGYQFASAQPVGLVEILFPAASVQHQLVFEVSSNGTDYTQVLAVDSATYDGTYKSFFRVASPSSAVYFRARQVGGATNLKIREMKLYARSVDKGRVYKWDDDASPVRWSRIPCIALEAGVANSRFAVQTQPGAISDMSGLTASSLYYSSTTAGGLSLTPNAKAIVVGEASSATALNFNPYVSAPRAGTVFMFAGAIADLPPGSVIADGSQYSREVYSEGYQRLGTKHTGTDNQTSFSVPNLTDRFIIAAASDDSGVPKTNYTGSLTQSGGARAASIAAGGGGANVAEVSVPNGALQVNLDPKYYALAFAVQLW